MTATGVAAAIFTAEIHRPRDLLVEVIADATGDTAAIFTAEIRYGQLGEGGGGQPDNMTATGVAAAIFTAEIHYRQLRWNRSHASNACDMVIME